MLNGVIKEFKVNRNKWLRGSTSELIDDNGNMCCLGFICNQLGIPKASMKDKDNPYEIKVLLPYLTEMYHSLIVDSDLAKKAVQFNDDSNLFESEREAQLIKLFKKHNLTLKFES